MRSAHCNVSELVNNIYLLVCVFLFIFGGFKCILNGKLFVLLTLFRLFNKYGFGKDVLWKICWYIYCSINNRNKLYYLVPCLFYFWIGLPQMISNHSYLNLKQFIGWLPSIIFTITIIRSISISGTRSNIAYAYAWTAAFVVCACAQDLGIADLLMGKTIKAVPTLYLWMFCW